MLTDTQQKQFAAFVANLLHVIRTFSNATPEQAELIARLATTTLLNVIFCIVPDDEPNAVDIFAVATIAEAIKQEYAVKVHD